MIDCFRAAIADIGGFVQPVAAFHLIILTGLVACGTGSTFDAADNDFAAYIGFTAVVTMDAEVFCIIKGTLVVPVRNPVRSDLFGNRSRILAKIFCNVLEGDSLVKGIFNVDAVFRGVRCFWFPGMYLLIDSPSTAVRSGNESTIPYEEVKINCAGVNATDIQNGEIYKFISGTTIIRLGVCT